MCVRGSHMMPSPFANNPFHFILFFIHFTFSLSVCVPLCLCINSSPLGMFFFIYFKTIRNEAKGWYLWFSWYLHPKKIGCDGHTQNPTNIFRYAQGEWIEWICEFGAYHKRTAATADDDSKFIFGKKKRF